VSNGQDCTPIEAGSGLVDVRTAVQDLNPSQQATSLRTVQSIPGPVRGLVGLVGGSAAGILEELKSLSLIAGVADVAGPQVVGSGAFRCDRGGKQEQIRLT
jgi:hypothetical protein